MAGKRKLTIEIAGDAKGASKAMDTVGSKATRMGSKVGKAGKIVGKSFAALAVAGVAAAAALGPKILELGGGSRRQGNRNSVTACRQTRWHCSGEAHRSRFHRAISKTRSRCRCVTTSKTSYKAVG